MTTLYTQQSKNIRKTWLLMGVFLIVVVGISWVFSQVYGDSSFVAIAVIFSLFMNFSVIGIRTRLYWRCLGRIQIRKKIWSFTELWKIFALQRDLKCRKFIYKRRITERVRDRQERESFGCRCHFRTFGDFG